MSTGLIVTISQTRRWFGPDPGRAVFIERGLAQPNKAAGWVEGPAGGSGDIFKKGGRLARFLDLLI